MTEGITTDCPYYLAAKWLHPEGIFVWDDYAAETTSRKNSLSEKEQRILKFISARQSASRAEIEAATGLSQSVTVRTLKKLLELGAIQKRGNGKNTVYGCERK